MPLDSSESAPCRMTIARSGRPALTIAFSNPSAIDSTPTSTTTTPAMPMIATPAELNRCGIV